MVLGGSNKSSGESIVGKEGKNENGFARGCTGCDLLCRTDVRERQKSGSIQTIRDVRIQCSALQPNTWAKSMPEGISHAECRRRLHMVKREAKRRGNASLSQKGLALMHGATPSLE